MEIKVYGNPVLRRKSKPLEYSNEIVKLAKEMINAMYEAKGIGLAAPQIGKNIRLVVIDLQDDTGAKILINPEIYWQSSEKDKMEEGCLSVPGINANVERPIAIKYRYIDEFGNCQTNISPDELNDLGKNIGDVLSVNIQNQEIKMTWSQTYQNDGVNQVGLITDSWGMISIFAKNNNASEIIGVIDGEKIEIKK
jgi:peptide deformylase